MPCAFDPPRQAAEPCIMAQLSPSAIPTGGQLGRPLRGYSCPSRGAPRDRNRCIAVA